MAKKAKPKKIEPYQDSCRFGILNHVGGIWSSETFNTMERAQAYLDKQREEWPGGADGALKNHKVIPVRVVVSAIPSD